jgi:hypothetical protein
VDQRRVSGGLIDDRVKLTQRGQDLADCLGVRADIVTIRDDLVAETLGEVEGLAHLRHLRVTRLLRRETGCQRAKGVLDQCDFAQLILAELGDANRARAGALDEAVLFQASG